MLLPHRPSHVIPRFILQPARFKDSNKSKNLEERLRELARKHGHPVEVEGRWAEGHAEPNAQSIPVIAVTGCRALGED